MLVPRRCSRAVEGQPGRENIVELCNHSWPSTTVSTWAHTTSEKNYPTQINKMCYSDAMKKTDGRSLPHSAREAIRRHAVAQVLSGESPEKVIKALGFHRSCIDDWLSRYEQGGEQALSTGKITGRPRKCPDEYADRLRELVKTNPLQLDFHDALWTRSMIQI